MITIRTIALAGNPNVGKSTIFNALTGLNQHTGNWTGKTVSTAKGICHCNKGNYILVDLPGTYSLNAHSLEEEVARDFICFEKVDLTVVVCDATCLERNLNLVLQILEITDNVAVCVNLLDEAKRKGINIDLKKLSEKLGVGVIGVSANCKKDIKRLCDFIDNEIKLSNRNSVKHCAYPEIINKVLKFTDSSALKLSQSRINHRWLTIKYLEGDIAVFNKAAEYLNCDQKIIEEFNNSINAANDYLISVGVDREKLKDIVVGTILNQAHSIAIKVLKHQGESYYKRDRYLDKIITGKITAYPVMVIMLAVILWITVIGANYPSQLLSELLLDIEYYLHKTMQFFNVPKFIEEMTVSGGYRVLAWVVSVMLPPMAIFFPLFTLLEDCGFLPRIAYNLDKPFNKCNACGKQALTMCMGFGCNAVGVIGCRIIDSKRERLLAILTNSFVPCNGRFPTLITLISVFCVVGINPYVNSIINALGLCLIIVVSVITTLGVTKLISHVLLKGKPSSFILEMPPYRKPNVSQVIVRSILDRTLYVLARAAIVAFPAGIVIWIMTNISISDITLYTHISKALNPLGVILGMDGVILLAFILGLPANEIVLPIIIMVYSMGKSLGATGESEEIGRILINNGWTIKTAVCVCLFSIMHWPCSSTLLTIKNETKSFKWTALAAILPTVIGMAVCACVNILFTIIN